MTMRIDIEGIDFEKSNVIFVNGMTLEKVKISYNWLLNAKIKDAIIGEDDRGIVWYFGDWYCGEWEDGTWYSGNFYSGVWKNGLFYSYQLDKFDVLNEIFSIKQTGNQYSTFHNGLWMTGTFYAGTFGESGTTEDWTDFTLYDATYEGYEYQNYKKSDIVIGGAIQYIEKNLATWVDGIFQNGLIYNAIWNGGRHVTGNMTNSKWVTGMWFNGIFNGDTWHDGSWYNGNFIKGNWLNGTFCKLKNNVVSRFGNTTLSTTDNSAICNWYNGTWKNGEWFSGYVTDVNDNPIESQYNYLSVWHDGVWENGTWYGGHFKKGTWKNGIWKNGIFGFLNSTEWTIPKLASQPDTRLSYKWSGDTSNPTQTTVSTLVTTSNTANTYYELSHYIQDIDITVTIVDVPTSSITFTQSSTIYFTRDQYDSILNTGSYLRYNFTEINEWCENRFVLNGVVYTPVTITKLGVDTWQVILSGSLPATITSSVARVRRQVKLDDGSGSGMTYWKYDDIKLQVYANIYNLVRFIGTKPHNFTIGEYVSIEQEDGYTNARYNSTITTGIATQVVDTGTTAGKYYVTVAKKYKENAANNTGKIVKYVGLMSSRFVLYSSVLSFQDFDFNYDFITDTTNTLINGYAIKFDTDVLLNNSYRTPYKNIYSSLPFKDLVLSGIDSWGNKTYNITVDTCYYTPSLYNTGVTNYPNIPDARIKYTYLENKSDNSIKTWYFGGFNDMWGLVDNNGLGLETYYPTGETVVFDPDLYNPRLPYITSDRLRTSLMFQMEFPIAQQLRISNLQVKTYYSNLIEVPIWYNGTWEKGTWYNGDFYNGSYLSGMWITGNFYGGYMASNYR